jgi:uncharacterized protein (TIGR03083 family)
MLQQSPPGSYLLLVINHIADVSSRANGTDSGYGPVTQGYNRNYTNRRLLRLRCHMQPVEPIIVIDLFPQERKHLLDLFAELTEEDWQKSTVCPGWSVKDIGLHLLGDDIGYLSGHRDHFSNPFFTGRNMENWESLVQNINEANELWVLATQRISPVLLSTLLELTGKQFYEHLSSLDPMAMNGQVNWAGPQNAPVWLDIAREYTERWLHQQQIRDAVNRPGLKERQIFSSRTGYLCASAAAYLSRCCFHGDNGDKADSHRRCRGRLVHGRRTSRMVSV